MGDPLSITASIIAIIQLTQQVIGYVIDVKNSSDDSKRILNELASAHTFLFLLEDKAKRSGTQWDKTMRSLVTPNGPLEQFKNALELLASKLGPRKGLKKVKKALSWSFQKREIKEILGTIERQKTLFILALHNDHMYAGSFVHILTAGLSHKQSNVIIRKLRTNFQLWSTL